ncbi:hypothetical protein [Nocardia sp. Marseille-Q1738]
MPENTDKNPTADIRSLYVETLTRAELATVSFIASDGYRSIGVRTNEEAAQAAVDALAAAGLLPVMDQRRVWYDVEFNQKRAEHCLIHNWREVSE